MDPLEASFYTTFSITASMNLFGLEINLLYVFGVLAAIAVGLVVLGILLGTALAVWFWKTRKVLLPRLTVILMNFFEVPVHALLSLLGIKKDSAYIIREEMLNKLYEKDYEKVPADKRIIFLPQCLRNTKCPAPVDEEGIHCIKCGLCGIGNFMKKAEEYGVKVFIAPGGSMIPKIFKKYKPKAIFGVACHPEIRLASDLVVWMNIPAQAVPLLKDGCVNTEVDWEEAERVAFKGLKKRNKKGKKRNPHKPA